MKMLVGLRSQWIRPAASIASRPRAQSRAMASASPVSSCLPRLRNSWSRSPRAMYSMAMKQRPSASPTSKTVTTLAWLIAPAALASLSRRSVADLVHHLVAADAARDAIVGELADQLVDGLPVHSGGAQPCRLVAAGAGL